MMQMMLQTKSGRPMIRRLLAGCVGIMLILLSTQAPAQQADPGGGDVDARLERIAGEIRTLIISGVIRTVDIGPSNTIRSQYVSNFSVCYEGNGPETSFTRQGWAGRIMNKIWPF